MRMRDAQGEMPAGVIGPLANDDFADVYFSLLARTAPKLPHNALVRDADRLRLQGLSPQDVA